MYAVTFTLVPSNFGRNTHYMFCECSFEKNICSQLLQAIKFNFLLQLAYHTVVVIITIIYEAAYSHTDINSV